MHSLSVAAAADRLGVEDAIETVERRIERAPERFRAQAGRERDVAHLLDAWDEMPFVERQAAPARRGRARHRHRRLAQPDPPGLRVAAKSITIAASAEHVLTRARDYASNARWRCMERSPLQNGVRLKLRLSPAPVGLNLYPSKGGGCKIVFDQPGL